MQTRINKREFKQMVVDQNSYAPNNINFFFLYSFLVINLLCYCVRKARETNVYSGLMCKTAWERDREKKVASSKS